MSIAVVSKVAGMIHPGNLDAAISGQNNGLVNVYLGTGPELTVTNYAALVDPGGIFEWPANTPLYAVADLANASLNILTNGASITSGSTRIIGTVEVSGNTTIGGPVELAAGTTVDISGPVTLASGSTVDLAAGSTVDISGPVTVQSGLVNTLASHIPNLIDTKHLTGPNVGGTTTLTLGPYDVSNYASMKLILTTSAAGPLPGGSSDAISFECVFTQDIAGSKVIARTLAYFDPAGYFGSVDNYGMRAVSVVGQYFWVNIVYTSQTSTGGNYTGVHLNIDVYVSHQELIENQYSSFSVRNTDPSLAISSYWSLSEPPSAEVDLAIGSKSGDTYFILFSEGSGTAGYAYLYSYINGTRIFWSGLSMPSTTPAISSLQNSLYLPPAPLWIGLRSTAGTIGAILTQADKG